MKVTFDLESEEAVEAVLAVFKKYRELNWDPDVRFEERYYDWGDEKVLQLCTGNRWIVRVSEQTLTYEGSREGFVALTPFSNLNTASPCARIYNNERGRGIELYVPRELTGRDAVLQRAELCQYETSHPDLKDPQYFSATIEPLREEPGKAIIMNPGPKRVVSYSPVR
jgi:hypothetical protein